jgi:hypothetical protein
MHGAARESVSEIITVTTIHEHVPIFLPSPPNPLHRVAVGQPEQFAKRTFAEETERVTQGAVFWQDAPEIGLTKVQGDGLLLVQRPGDLAGLPLPWPRACAHDELFVELKMPGDHLDVRALQRALLRRQARQVQRVEDTEPPWLGEEPLWLVAPHVPEILGRLRDVQALGPGCYQVGPSAFPLLWIAANELPLRDELIPFLVARSGRALEEFAFWVITRRPVDWLMDMVQYISMPTSLREEILRRFPPTDDPEILERRAHIVRVWLPTVPEVRREVLDEGRQEGLVEGRQEGRQEGLVEGRQEGRLIESRRGLRRVLTLRGLTLDAENEARIDACADLATLERWHDQAVTASTTAEALR